MFDLLGWARRLVSGAKDGARGTSLATLLTPQAVRGERPLWQLLGVAATLGAIGLAALVGLAGAALVTLALGAILFLLTEILGLDLDIDPRAFRIFSGFPGFGGSSPSGG